MLGPLTLTSSSRRSVVFAAEIAQLCTSTPRLTKECEGDQTTIHEKFVNSEVVSLLRPRHPLIKITVPSANALAYYGCTGIHKNVSAFIQLFRRLQ